MVTKQVMSIGEVADILADLFGDDCACNFNGTDEWLPFVCDYRDTECPNPKKKKRLLGTVSKI